MYTASDGFVSKKIPQKTKIKINRSGHCNHTKETALQLHRDDFIIHQHDLSFNIHNQSVEEACGVGRTME